MEKAQPRNLLMPRSRCGSCESGSVNHRTVCASREERSHIGRLGGEEEFIRLSSKRTAVAIIIPYRNRHEHLKHLLFYLHPMLVRQQLDYGIYVINQDGEGVFNKAKLMNVGFAEALKDYDYECFVFSDVDLVPMDDRNFYRCFESPRHLSVAIDKFNFQLPYNTIFGGVSSFSKQQFLTVNGYSNTYWGWGGEDDDMYKRIIFHGMSINQPDHMTGKYKMIKHQRDKNNEVSPNMFLHAGPTPPGQQANELILLHTLKEVLHSKYDKHLSVLHFLLLNTLKNKVYANNGEELPFLHYLLLQLYILYNPLQLKNDEEPLLLHKHLIF
ncbi:Beta-1,4-galactosyltransferase 1 [Takifugu flavidus]|uniref:Beta-1,4-galactosyltransferase n=1 Tax=Takifugu flavidus TaxID=433684 RepID=A0A5C6NWV7_9TELE|nr:Beta-1,4-galactosyltransferase 1 [Takifugu flavidus]